MTGNNIDTINIFARITRQHDVIDRIAYMTRRQGEKFVCSAGNSDMSYWHQLALECSRSTKNGKATQAREIIVYVPNKFLLLDNVKQKAILSALADNIRQWCGTDCIIAAHNSRPDDEIENAHLHILIADRPLLHKNEIKYAERNMFYGADHRRRRTKKEILDENGNLMEGCYIIRKGEAIKLFDKKYSDMDLPCWAVNMKKHLAEWINEVFIPDIERVVYTADSPYIPQQHIDKKYSTEIKNRIKEDNNKIKTWNRLVREGGIFPDEAMFYKGFILLSPERGIECENIYRSLYFESYPEEYDMPEQLISSPRTVHPMTAEELKKRELRRFYRAAQNERNLAAKAKDYNERLHHQKLARHYSAEIDRMKKEAGQWDLERYYREMQKDQEELQKLQAMIENTKYRIYLYAQKSGEIYRSKYITEKRNLSDLYIAEKALTRQIAKNKEIFANANAAAQRKMDFTKRLESAKARSNAQKESKRDHSKPHEAVFGDGSYSKAQAIMDLLQIQREYGIQNDSELMETIDSAEKNLVRLKEALNRNEDVIEYHNNKRKDAAPEDIFKIEKYIRRLQKEQEEITKLISLREQEYRRLRKALYGLNAAKGYSQDEFSDEISYNELFDRHAIRIDYEHEER